MKTKKLRWEWKTGKLVRVEVEKQPVIGFAGASQETTLCCLWGWTALLGTKQKDEHE